MPRRPKHVPMLKRQQMGIVRQAVADQLAIGHVVPSLLAASLWDRYRAEWSDIARDLCVDSIKSSIRTMCKDAMEKEEKSLFPGAPDHLPRALSIPGADGKEPYYVATRKASIVECKQALGGLSIHIAASIQRRDALAVAIRNAERMGGADSDLLIEVLTGRVFA